MDSEAVLQGIEENLAGSTLRVSGKLDISQSSVVRYHYDHSKIIQSS